MNIGYAIAAGGIILGCIALVVLGILTEAKERQEARRRAP